MVEAQLEAEQALTALRDTVLALVDDVAGLARTQVGPDAEKAVHDVATTVRGQSYNVVVCGEFKRGKSSLLNAIVDRKQLFPTGDRLTTSTVMTLRWGPRPRAVAHTVTADGERADEIPVDGIKEYVTADEGPRAWRVTQVDVELPHDRLASGVVLVDTPGLGGVDEIHSAITLRFLPKADAVVLVLSAVQPASVSELEFAKRALAEKPAVIFALAMADQRADIDLRVEAARARLSAYVDVPPEKLNIVAVSAFEAWHAREAGDARRLEASGLPALEREIWTTLVTEAAAHRLRAAIRTLTRLTEDASAPVASELAALAGPDELARVLAELDQNEARALEVGAELKDQGRLEQEFASRVSGIERAFRDQVVEVLRRLRSALADEGEPMTIEAVTALAMKAAEASSTAFTALQESARALADEWERRTAQPLRVLGLGSHEELKLPDAPAVVRPRVEFTPAVTGGAQGAAALTAPLAALGGVVGSFFGGGGAVPGATVGGVIGQLVGFFGGLVDHIRQTNAKARARALREYMDQVIAALTDYRGDTVVRFEDTQQEILQHLKLQMRTLNRAQLSTIGEARLRVREAAQANEAVKAARGAELRAQRDVVAGYAARLHALRRELSAIEENLTGAGR
jgi:hypothetical protein